MSKVFIEETTLSSIGDAIREKTGKSELIAPGDMPTEIAGITTSSGGDYLQSLKDLINDNITEAPAELFEKVDTIPNYLFYNKKALTKVTIPDNITTLGTYSLGSTSISECVMPSKLITIESGAFDGCRQLETIDFSKVEGDTSTSSKQLEIAGSAFDGCKKLKKINRIYNSDIKVNYGNWCFSDAGLESFSNIGDKLGTCGMGMFYGCKSLKKAIFNPSTIPAYTFQRCSSLQAFFVAVATTWINSYAFAHSGLKVLCIHGAPPKLDNVNAFEECPLEAIYVSSSRIEEMKTMTNWATYADLIKSKEDVTEEHFNLIKESGYSTSIFFGK